MCLLPACLTPSSCEKERALAGLSWKVPTPGAGSAARSGFPRPPGFPPRRPLVVAFVRVGCLLDFLDLPEGRPRQRAVPQLRDRGTHPGQFGLPHGLRVFLLDPEEPRETGNLGQ